MIPWGGTSLPEDTDGQNLSGPPTKDQEIVQMEAHIQAFLGAILEGPPPRK